MKTTSRFALATAAVGLMASSAMAADLGGNCCADLEERVAELEATTARKGNRKVSLTVYGQVNEQIMFWDDDVERNAYVVTNEHSRSRFGFRGEAQITPDWSAGYRIEVGVRIANSAAVNQFVDDNTSTSASLDVRYSEFYVNSKTYGRLYVGQTDMATEGITEINLSRATVVASNDINNWNGGFFLRTGAGLSAVTWNNISSQANANVGEGDRRNGVRYVTPTFAGFTASAAWGEDDFWDVALRYAGEFNGIRLAGGIGYQRWTDGSAYNAPTTGTLTSGNGDRGCADLNTLGVNVESDVDCYALGLSGSIMHMPTGLYVFGAYGFLQDDNRRDLFAAEGFGNVKKKDEHFYIQAGIERKFIALGATTFYGDYFKGDTGAGLSSGAVRVVAGTDALSAGTICAGVDCAIASSEVEAWGLGVVQQIDAAAMDVYLGYRHYSGDVTLTDGADSEGVSVKDWQAFTAGAIIRF